MPISTAPTAHPPANTWAARMLRFPLTRILLALVTIAVPFAAVNILLRLYVTDRSLRALGALLLAAVILLAYRAYVRLIERRTLSELSRPRFARELLVGMLLGALLFSLTIGIIAALGAYQVNGTNGWYATLAVVPGYILAAVLEEVVIRGVVFRILQLWLGSWIALALSAILFGLLHFFNPGATLLSAIAIMLEAGILLGAAYMLTRRLWLCMGLHFAWNFTQGGIFSASVSGGVTHGLLNATLAGPVWLTGGAFGPEASVVAVVVCVVAGLLLLVAAQRKGHVIQPAWSRALSATP
jgi:membrane protease YdiL (CAAX protease family)